jgi:hypothetical protein
MARGVSMKSAAPWMVLLVSVAAMVSAWFYFTEEYQTQVWIGEGKQAKLNPYLAAQRFLEDRGLNVYSGNEQLDFSIIPTSDLVFLSKVDSMLVSQTQVDAALDWVSRGGYLLVGVTQEIAGHASILKEFDIEPEYKDVEIAEAFLDDDGDPMSASERMEEINRKIEERRAQEKQQDSDGLDQQEEVLEKPVELNKDDTFEAQIFDLLNVDYAHEFYRTPIGDDGEELYLAALDRIVLSHPLVYGDFDAKHSDDYEMVAWVDDEHGERLLQFAYGDGTFTALSSTEYWTNKYIGLGDHAYFLSYLFSDGSNLHLFYNVSVPTIGHLLNKYFGEAIWAALVLLGLWLWNRGPRVQKVIDVVEGQRRSFSEHLAASAEFLTANKQFHVLIKPIQEDIEQQMRPHYPGFSQLNQHAQASMLAQKTQLPESTLHDWLGYCQKVENQQQLIAALKLGNAIRKKL